MNQRDKQAIKFVIVFLIMLGALTVTGLLQGCTQTMPTTDPETEPNEACIRGCLDYQIEYILCYGEQTGWQCEELCDDQAHWATWGCLDVLECGEDEQECWEVWNE
jgi:hypothetical protein